MKSLLALLLSTGVAFAQASVTPYPTTNRSVSIITGGTYQTVVPAVSTANPRKSLTIENNNTNSDNCRINVDGGTPSDATSILLAPKGGSYTRYYPYVPSAAIQATCDGNGDTLYVDTQ